MVVDILVIIAGLCVDILADGTCELWNLSCPLCIYVGYQKFI